MEGILFLHWTTSIYEGFRTLTVPIMPSRNACFCSKTTEHQRTTTTTTTPARKSLKFLNSFRNVFVDRLMRRHSTRDTHRAGLSKKSPLWMLWWGKSELPGRRRNLLASVSLETWSMFGKFFGKFLMQAKYLFIFLEIFKIFSPFFC